MLRPVILLAALAATVPAAAATYSAKLAVPTTQRIIARDISWSCGADVCQGATAESRPVVLCQSLAKRAGKVDSFLIDGRAFDPAELAQCNTAAKAQPGQAIAAQ
jgi:hypothetical protein